MGPRADKPSRLFTTLAADKKTASYVFKGFACGFVVLGTALACFGSSDRSTGVAIGFLLGCFTIAATYLAEVFRRWHMEDVEQQNQDIAKLEAYANGKDDEDEWGY